MEQKPRPKLVIKRHQHRANWIELNDSVNYKLQPNPDASKPLAMYDLDNTLLDFETGEYIDTVCQHAKDHLDTHIVCIISNQYGTVKGYRTHDQVKSLFSKVEKYLGREVNCIYSYAQNQYRKPMTGMFDLLMDKLCLNTTNMFYCGDSAGRKGDYSPGDLYFAHNIGARFIVAPNLTEYSKTPKALYIPPSPIHDHGYIDQIMEQKTQHDQKPLLIMMIGPQAAGKSTLSDNLAQLLKIEILSKDHHKRGETMDNLFKQRISKSKSMIIDNTNPTIDNRFVYLSAASAAGYHIIGVFFDIPKLLSTHLCHMRVEQGGKYIPPVARHTYYKRLEKPTTSEGFNKLLTVPGWLCLTETPEEYKYWFHINER